MHSTLFLCQEHHIYIRNIPLSGKDALFTLQELSEAKIHQGDYYYFLTCFYFVASEEKLQNDAC